MCGILFLQVIHRLGAEAPKKSLVENYMIEIARNYKVDYDPDPSMFLVSFATSVQPRFYPGHLFPSRRMTSFLVRPLCLLSHSFLTMSHREAAAAEEEEEGEGEQVLCLRRKSLATSTPHSLNHPHPHNR